MRVGIAILGLGRIGLTHLQTLRAIPAARIIGLCDPHHHDLAQLAQSANTQVMDYADVLQDPEIQAVLICTPTSQHAQQIRDCASHQKAIFCEKPIDLDYAVAEQTVRDVQAKNARLMLGFNRRFDPHFRQLKNRLDQGDIGTVEMVMITSRDPAPPPIEYIHSSGGLFKDMMIHDIDMVHFLTDDVIVTQQATGANLIDPAIGAAGDVDTAALQGKTAKGIVYTISNSRRASYGYDQRIEVHGAKGMLQAANCHENTLTRADASGFTTAPTEHFFMERYHQAYRHEMLHFIDALTRGSPFSPNGEDGLHALMVADRATKDRR